MSIEKNIKLLEELEGAGEPANKGDHVTYNLRAYLSKGDEIPINYRDSAIPLPEKLFTHDSKGELFNFVCVIGKREALPAVEYTLLGMKEGGYRKVKSPPHLAYGKEDVPNKIPKNAVIIFEIWLRKLQCVIQHSIGTAKVSPLIQTLDYSVKKHLFFFRPGEEARMLARCQFGASENGECGATLTYPIKGYPWRHNVMKSYTFPLAKETISLLFAEVHRIRSQYPEQCLANDKLWSDSSEKANGITRDKATGTLCYTIGIMVEGGSPDEYFAIREDSEALRNSVLYKTISKLILPYEKL